MKKMSYCSQKYIYNSSYRFYFKFIKVHHQHLLHQITNSKIGKSLWLDAHLQAELDIQLVIDDT